MITFNSVSPGELCYTQSWDRDSRKPQQQSDSVIFSFYSEKNKRPVKLSIINIQLFLLPPGLSLSSNPVGLMKSSGAYIMLMSVC